MDPLERILEETYTKRQLVTRARILKDYLSYRLFEGGKSFDDYLESKQKDINLYNSIQKESKWLNSLGEDFYIKITPELFDKIFETIEKKIKDLKNLTIYLPREIPSEDELSLGQWLKKNVSKEIIYEINLDPNLVGGCALSYLGNYRDYSLRKKITDNSQAIRDSLKDFKEL